MQVGDKREFLTLSFAGRAYDDGWVNVTILGLVLEQDFSVRDITDEERGKISYLADEYSASK
jgi:hypothetical protein